MSIRQDLAKAFCRHEAKKTIKGNGNLDAEQWRRWRDNGEDYLDLADIAIKMLEEKK